MTDIEIVKEHDWLIKKVATNFYCSSKEDLYQAGVLGILKALKNYKKNGTTKFSTYAFDYVFGEMYQFVYKNQSIKLSRDVLRTFQKLEMTRSALSQKLNRIPTNLEIANFLELDPNMVEQIICYGSYYMMSLDETKNDEERNYYEIIAQEENISLDDSLTLQDSIQSLNDEEQKIIRYRYFSDLTQQEVAHKLNMTQVMVSRYEKKGIQKLRRYYDQSVA